MPIKYSNGKIYKLVCSNGHYYIGSTASELRFKLREHKNASLEKTEDSLYVHINKIGWDNVSIKLLEEFPCNTKAELNARTNYHIECAKKLNDNLCLNVIRATPIKTTPKPTQPECDESECDESECDESECDESECDESECDESESYVNGKIYKLLCTDGYYYIGSTISSLNIRFTNHKQCAKKNHIAPIYKHINKIGINNVSINLIEEYPCNSSKELKAREDYYIKTAHDKACKLCLNIKRAHISKEERRERDKKYYEENKEILCEYGKIYRKYNKEKIIAYSANYRQENADKIRAYNKEYVEKNAAAVKERQQAYYKANKEEITQRNAEYHEKYKEKFAKYKKEWSRKKREETADERAAASEKKRAIRQEKSAARVARDRTIHTCDCGGSYQAYQKKRHMENKKHLAYLDRGTSTASEEYKTAHKRKLQDYKNEWARKKNAEVAAAIADERAAVKAEKRAKIEEQMEATRERITEVHTCDCGGTYHIYLKKRHEQTKKHLTFFASNQPTTNHLMEPPVKPLE